MHSSKHRVSGSHFRFSSLDELCRSLGATRVIRRLLVANNGLAAVKGIDSIRAWLYEHIGDADAISFVVMATPDDLKANAEFISMADQHVVVSGGPNANNYANVELIMHTALQQTCDAVYPGWGHASENPALPRECERSRRVTFLGPSEEAMFALGDKIASTIVAQSCGVPTVPWSGEAIRLEPGGVEVSAALYEQAYVHSAEACEEVCKRIGLPVMLKAAEGGGGKGIRRCTALAQVGELFRAVTEEVKGCHVFVMRMLEQVRHIEVQLLADAYGACIALRTRDCSVQRRHQKIIEEGPAPGVSPAVLAAMEAAAIRLARAVQYRGVGTVEFLYDRATERFYFLELNPRLQVEHPVSELLTGVNLPAALLCVGMGIALHRIPEVRTMYGERAYGTAAIDFARRESLPPHGHTIAVRVTAEDTDEGFRPTSGRVDEILFKNSKECWGYFSIGPGGAVHQFADSQFGHLFASGPTREDARRAMVLALRNLVIRGEIRTSTAYVLELLESAEFCEGGVSTDWLDKLIAQRAAEASPESPSSPRYGNASDGGIGGGVHVALLAAAVFRNLRYVQNSREKYLSYLQSGHVPSTDYLCNAQGESYVHRGNKYSVTMGRISATEYGVSLNGRVLVVPYRILKSGALQLTVGARTLVAYVTEEPNSIRITVSGRVFTFSGDVDPTMLYASVPGRLVRYLVNDGARVCEGDAFAEIEVMKMILPLRVNVAGVLHQRAVPGSTITMGLLLAEVTPDDASKVARPREVQESWPPELLVAGRYERPDGVTRAQRAINALWSMLSGYHIKELPLDERLRRTLDDLASLFLSSVTLQSLQLPFALEDMATTPSPGSSFDANVPGGKYSPSVALTLLPRSTAQLVAADEASGAAAAVNINNNSSIGDKEVSYGSEDSSVHPCAPSSKLCTVFRALIERYLAVERPFDKHSRQEAIAVLRDERDREAWNTIYEIDFAHAQDCHHQVIRGVLEYLESNHVLLRSLRGTLQKLTELQSYSYGSLLLQARYLLRQCSLPTFVERKALFARVLEQGALRDLVASSYGYDLLCSIMFDRQYAHLVQVCLELFIRREYFSESTLDNLDIFKRGSIWYATYRHERRLDGSPLGLGDDEDDGVGTSPGEAESSNGGSSSSTSNGAVVAALNALRDEAAYDVPPALPRVSPPGAPERGSNGNGVAGGTHPTPQSPHRAARRGYGMCMVFANESVLRDELVVAFDVVGLGEPEATTACTVFFSVAQQSTQAAVAAVCHDVLARGAAHVAAQLPSLTSICFVVHGMTDGPHVFTFRHDLDVAEVHAGRCQACTHTAGCACDDCRRKTRNAEARTRDYFVEDTLVRNVLPQSVRRLELDRLVNYDVHVYPTPYKEVHLFCAVPKKPQASLFEHRLFARVAVTPHDMSMVPWTEGTEVDVGHMLAKCIAALEMAHADSAVRYPPCNHIFVKMIELTFELRSLRRLLLAAASTYENKLRTLGVREVELAFHVRVASGLIPMRVMVTTTTGYSASVHVYYESVENGRPCLHRAESAEDVACGVGCVPGGENTTEFLLNSPSSPMAGSPTLKVMQTLSKLEALRELLPSRRRPTPVATTPAAEAAVTAPTEVSEDETSDVGEEEETGAAAAGDAQKRRQAGATAMVSDTTRLRGLLEPYPPLSERQVRRLQAQAAHSVYVHDWPVILRLVVRKEWATLCTRRGLPHTIVPHHPLRVTELCLARTEGATANDDGGRSNGSREDATSALRPCTTVPPAERLRCGMIVWIADYAPASYYGGGGGAVEGAGTESMSEHATAWRRVVLVANDITYQSGSFAVPEDAVFEAASALARTEGLPFVYLSANSGARIGLSEPVKRRFRVAFTASHAIDYLYLTASDYEALTAQGVRLAVQKICGGATTCGDCGGDEVRYRIDGVVGAATEFIGVENLRGSGRIAGAMSANYHRIPTISVVSGRSVGIGAYLNRLGRRVIQTGDSPIILTGAPALNRLLGREVYADNRQLGGRQVMVPNGVTHWNPRHEYSSAKALLRWLDYVPAVAHPVRCAPRPLYWPVPDPVDRDVTFCPQPSTPYDPRCLVAGAVDRTGLFDAGSWTECLQGWAKTVVTGRATLGGLPCGVILVETRLTKRHSPADPADATSASSFVLQAGQVWFPDSARKTADALEDFHHERLPCFILANWRGFSGGMRDMYDEVLKFGAAIVDNLRVYTAPVFIYIPPCGELRGGAWVVVDPTINHHGAVEMYCDTSARGGILEAAGVAEIKFRDKDVRELVRRCRPDLTSPLSQSSPQARAEEDALLPQYRDVAVRFAELHDTPFRMCATGVMHDIVPWVDSRRIFYRKLRRKLAELAMANDLVEGGVVPDLRAGVERIVRLYTTTHDMNAAAAAAWGRDDAAQLAWLEQANTRERLMHRDVAVGDVAMARLRDALRECGAQRGGVTQCLQTLFHDPALAESARLALRSMSDAPKANGHDTHDMAASDESQEKV